MKHLTDAELDRKISSFLSARLSEHPELANVNRYEDALKQSGDLVRGVVSRVVGITKKLIHQESSNSTTQTLYQS